LVKKSCKVFSENLKDLTTPTRHTLNEEKKERKIFQRGRRKENVYTRESDNNKTNNNDSDNNDHQIMDILFKNPMKMKRSYNTRSSENDDDDNNESKINNNNNNNNNNNSSYFTRSSSHIPQMSLELPNSRRPRRLKSKKNIETQNVDDTKIENDNSGNDNVSNNVNSGINTNIVNPVAKLKLPRPPKVPTQGGMMKRIYFFFNIII
jgi:hypothetical protein